MAKLGEAYGPPTSDPEPETPDSEEDVTFEAGIDRILTSCVDTHIVIDQLGNMITREATAA